MFHSYLHCKSTLLPLFDTRDLSKILMTGQILGHAECKPVTFYYCSYHDQIVVVSLSDSKLSKIMKDACWR